ncbi:MAG: cytochrome b [Burkholderiales bacterium]|jgi:cytochrome b561|nr:cytochrome b [Burkholderiales bacterium]
MTRYTRVAAALHWLIAVAILANFVFGTWMVDLDLSPAKLRYYSYHKWLGVSVFLLVLVRIAWRIGHRPPALPTHMPTWERVAAGVSHFALYGLTLAVPLSGWLFSSAKGFKTVYFALIPIPDLLAKNPALADTLKLWHLSLNYVMALLILLHVAAALKHHFMDRDDVLVRMWPFGRSATGAKS